MDGGIREIAIKQKNVMLNLFQHLIKSIGYETLKRVQGDKEADSSNAFLYLDIGGVYIM